jgi:PAS domain-containing protein
VAPAPAAEVSLSAPGRQKSAEASAIESAQEAVAADPMLALLKAMLFRLFGIEIEVFDARELQDAPASEVPADLQAGRGAAPAGFGVEYDFHAERTETEELRFAAEGVVQTADGQTIRFAVAFEMSRSFTERIDVSLRLGDAARKKDPLVVNFAGTAAQLSDRTFRIDLDGDGRQDEAHFVAEGSGFLVFDRNADGRIDRANELFGPRTGDGFAELAQLDADRNGWIDEADADYAKLQVWTKDATGADRLQSLEEANVGAISLARLATPFSIRDGSNALLGEARSSGVYLSEDGKAGTIQQIDLAV